MNKQLLIFDLDGTLIDSVPDISSAANAMLAELNMQNYGVSEVRNWVGNGSHKLVERALMAANNTNTTPSEQDINHAHNVFLEKYTQCAAVNTIEYTGVTTGLKQLKQAGYTLALVTNKPMQFVPAILDFFEWTNLFDITLGGDSLSKKKPDPMPLYHVCDALKFHVEQCYMIGDSKNDILAGQNAGMKTLGVSYGYNYGQDIREFNPTHAFDTFGDMVKFLLPS